MTQPTVRLGRRFADALVWAHDLHRSQARKGAAGIPYIAHLLAVAGLVLEAGGSEDEGIAALLHDAIEDQGVTPDEIARRFGDRVVAIVVGCSDTHLEWGGLGEERGAASSFRRKRAYLDHLARTTDTGVLRVSVADKLHNARSILADLHVHGEGVFSRFNVGRLGTLWWYRELARAYAAVLPRDAQAAELGRVVAAMRAAAGDPPDPDLDAAAARGGA